MIHKLLQTNSKKAQFIYLISRPAVGKSTLALNIVQSFLDDGRGVYIFDFATPVEGVMMKMLSAKTDVAYEKLLARDMSSQEREKVSFQSEIYQKQKLRLDDKFSNTITKIEDKLREIKSDCPEVSLCIIDYLQLIESEGNQDRSSVMRDVSHKIQLLVQELDMTIMILSHIPKGLEHSEDNRSELTDQLGLSSFVDRADMVLLLTRDKESEDAELIISKPKEQKKYVQLKFNKDTLKFIIH